MKKYLIIDRVDLLPLGGFLHQIREGDPTAHKVYVPGLALWTDGHTAGYLTGKEDHSGWNIFPADHPRTLIPIPEFNIGDVVTINTQECPYTRWSPYAYLRPGLARVSRDMKVANVNSITGALELTDLDGRAQQTCISPFVVTKTYSCFREASSKPKTPSLAEEAREFAEAMGLIDIESAPVSPYKKESSISAPSSSVDRLRREAEEILQSMEDSPATDSYGEEEEDEYDPDYEEEEEEEEIEDELSRQLEEADEQFELATRKPIAEKKVKVKPSREGRPHVVEVEEESSRFYSEREEKEEPAYRNPENQVVPTYRPTAVRRPKYDSKKLF